MSELTFEQLPLAAPIQRALSEKGYTTPSPIQAKAIPILIKGSDLLACAQTGTGKTAAFALPMLHRIAEQGRKPFRRGVRNLIVAPTRELAVQVADNFKLYGKHLNFRIGMVYGGVSEKPQVKQLFQGLDVLVATPGRLIDLMNQGHVDLSQVDCFVMDEADRMLDMGFIRDIRRISEELPKKRQTLLFSATMAPEITKLAHALLDNQEEIRIAPQGTTAEKVDQKVYFVKKGDKQSLLLDLIKERKQTHPDDLNLVFSRTKHGAKNLARKLEAIGINSDSIHGNKSQSAREKTLVRFRNGEIDVLVATDVAARGIDVKNITLVINFDLPMESDAYVHRIGRTARAGASGQAISFCSEDEVALLRFVEQLINKPVPIEYDHDYHAPSIEELHLSGRPVKKPPQGGGGGNRGPRRSGGQQSKRRPRGQGGGKRGGRPQGSGGGGSRRSDSRGGSSLAQRSSAPSRSNSNRGRRG